MFFLFGTESQDVAKAQGADLKPINEKKEGVPEKKDRGPKEKVVLVAKTEPWPDIVSREFAEVIQQDFFKDQSVKQQLELEGLYRNNITRYMILRRLTKEILWETLQNYIRHHFSWFLRESRFFQEVLFEGKVPKTSLSDSEINIIKIPLSSKLSSFSWLKRPLSRSSRPWFRSWFNSGSGSKPDSEPKPDSGSKPDSEPTADGMRIEVKNGEKIESCDFYVTTELDKINKQKSFEFYAFNEKKPFRLESQEGPPDMRSRFSFSFLELADKVKRYEGIVLNKGGGIRSIDLIQIFPMQNYTEQDPWIGEMVTICVETITGHLVKDSEVRKALKLDKVLKSQKQIIENLIRKTVKEELITHIQEHPTIRALLPSWKDHKRYELVFEEAVEQDVSNEDAPRDRFQGYKRIPFDPGLCKFKAPRTTGKLNLMVIKNGYVNVAERKYLVCVMDKLLNEKCFADKEIKFCISNYNADTSSADCWVALMYAKMIRPAEYYVKGRGWRKKILRIYGKNISRYILNDPLVKKALDLVSLSESQKQKVEGSVEENVKKRLCEIMDGNPFIPEDVASAVLQQKPFHENPRLFKLVFLTEYSDFISGNTIIPFNTAFCMTKKDAEANVMRLYFLRDREHEKIKEALHVLAVEKGEKGKETTLDKKEIIILFSQKNAMNQKTGEESQSTATASFFYPEIIQEAREFCFWKARYTGTLCMALAVIIGFVAFCFWVREDWEKRREDWELSYLTEKNEKTSS